MKYSIKTVLLVAYLFSVANGQTLKLGFRVEPSLLFMEKYNETSILFTPYSMCLTTLIEPIDQIDVELRPGIFLGGEELSGFEIGAYLRYKILSSLYIIGGINIHSNKASGHNSGGSYQKDILFKSVGLGFQKDHRLSIDLSYNWTSDKEYGYSLVTDWATYSKKVNKNINGILKLGFCLSWDIL